MSSDETPLVSMAPRRCPGRTRRWTPATVEDGGTCLFGQEEEYVEVHSNEVDQGYEGHYQVGQDVVHFAHSRVVLALPTTEVVGPWKRLRALLEHPNL